MKIAHNIKLSVFAHEEEDAEAILQKFLDLVPFDLEQEKLQMKQTTASGVREQKIEIFEILLTKEKHTSKFLAALKAKCGLAEDYWSERLEFQRYRTTSYAESQNRKRGQ